MKNFYEMSKLLKEQSEKSLRWVAGVLYGIGNWSDEELQQKSDEIGEGITRASDGKRFINKVERKIDFANTPWWRR